MKFTNFLSRYKTQTPLWIAAIPLMVLIVSLALTIKCFGADAIMGGSQIALLFASSVAATLAIVFCGCKWSTLEDAIIENIRTSASAIIILLLIGAISVGFTVFAAEEELNFAVASDLHYNVPHEELEHDIDHAGNGQIIQRALRVADRAQDRERRSGFAKSE